MSLGAKKAEGGQRGADVAMAAGHEILPVLLVWIVSAGVLNLRGLHRKAVPAVRSCTRAIRPHIERRMPG
jgi:hypothetical protein